MASNSKKGKHNGKVIMESYIQRKNTSWIFFKKYVKEFLSLLLYEDGSSVLEFKSDGGVKLRYDMETCIGVNLRIEMDEARANWPADADSECCFIVTDPDENKILYLIAENSKLAQQWTWKLRQYLKVPISKKKDGVFGIRDLIDVYNTLTQEPSLTSQPFSLKILGGNLGLADDTLQKLEDFSDTIEDRLYNCLSKWIRRYDQVDDKGGPKWENLVEALKKIKADEIAERVRSEFCDASSCEEEISYSEASQPIVGDESQPTVEAEIWLTVEAEILNTATDSPDQQISDTMVNLDTENQDKKNSQKKEFEGTQDRRSTFDTMKRALFTEMSVFSNKKMHCLITIDNKTRSAIDFHKCFVAKGRISDQAKLKESIPYNCHKMYFFEKYTTLSLDGCAAMLLLSAETSETTRCYFVVAFRNHAIKLGNSSKNRAALLILEDAKSMEKISDLQGFGKIMRNEDPKPPFDGCYKDDVYDQTFMSALVGKSDARDFRNICFNIAMIDNYSSKINVMVSHPEPIG